jgi:hypothetical protein
MQSALVLPLSDSQCKKAIHRLRDPIRTARFEIYLSALRANPGFDAGDSYSNSFSLKLLGDRSSTQLAFTF